MEYWNQHFISIDVIIKQHVTKAITEMTSGQRYGNFMATMTLIGLYHDADDLQLHMIHNIAGGVNRFIISFSVKIELT